LRASRIIGAAVLAAALAGGAAQAQAPAGGPRLNLLCTGTDATLIALTPTYRSGRPAYSSGMYVGESRAPAQLSVLVENGQVRVKPPKSSVPMFAKDAKDGWYELSDVAIDRLTIKGRLKWNRIDRSSLDVDRRNGAVTFGSFAGVCQQTSSDPEATKF